MRSAWLALILLVLPAQAAAQALHWRDTLNLTVSSCATGANRLQTESAVGFFFTDDGGSFVDDTTDANDAGANDVDPWPATPAVNDAVYWGHASEQFNMVLANIGTQGSTVMTVVWEYYNGTTWATLTTTREDFTDFDEATGNHHLMFEPPVDWATVSVNSQTAYWVRQRVSAFTSHTTNALLTQVFIGIADDDEASVVLIKSDEDETEDLWCKGSSTAAIDVGLSLANGTGALTIETPHSLNPGFSVRSSNEVYCCGDGGAVDLSVILMR